MRVPSGELLNPPVTSTCPEFSTASAWAYRAFAIVPPDDVVFVAGS